MMTTAARRAARVALFACALVGASTGLGVTLSPPREAVAASFHSAFGSSGAVTAVTAPGPVLSAADADLYRRLFDLQEGGRFAEADALIPRLGNPVLLGHLQAQRFLHDRYATRFAELQGWLAVHADHPQAARIHALARRKGNGPLAAPAWSAFTRAGGGDVSSQSYRESGAAWRSFRRALSQGATLTARQVAEGGSLSTLDRARMNGQLAYAYFIDGEDDLAGQWAAKAVAAAGDRAPTALWAGGLAAWRQNDITAAGAYFRALAGSADASPWLASAGAYWAARAALRTREPSQASHWLRQAAEQPRTFYGLLARRQLGLPLPFQWAGNGLSPTHQATLKATAAGRRAMALVEIGRTADAELELRGLVPGATTAPNAAALHAAILALADGNGMSSLAFALVSRHGRAQALPEGGGEGGGDDDTAQALLGARYPIPAWEPAGGWSLDRALVYAFMRQESGFNPDARSPVGAAGLMQVMPATARFVANRLGVAAVAPGAATRQGMLEPEKNIALGQKYLEHLLSLPEVDGNLFFLAVAYNAGPGNLAKWVARKRHGDDPLLFIEAIPSRETRIFVERVLANLWIYRDRMGQPNTSLDMVASGRWPRYAGQDGGGNLAATRRAF